MSHEKIIAEWKKKVFKPFYWLEGEEEYFIDKVVDYAEHNILNETETGFNLTVFYGKDAAWPDVINACRRYPMFSERQVVLLKEAQQMRDIEKLEAYIENPLSSTILVVYYKEKKIDGRTKFAKLLKDRGVLLSTKKIYENQLPQSVGRCSARADVGLLPGHRGRGEVHRSRTPVLDGRSRLRGDRRRRSLNRPPRMGEQPRSRSSSSRSPSSSGR